MRAVVYAGASIAGRDPRRPIQRVVGHLHAFVTGRPTDPGSAGAINAFGVSRQANQSPPEFVQQEVGVSLGVGRHA